MHSQLATILIHTFLFTFVADAAHWETVLEKLIHPPDELQEQDPHLSEYEKELVTDMLMLLEAQKKYGNKALGISVWEWSRMELNRISI